MKKKINKILKSKKLPVYLIILLVGLIILLLLFKFLFPGSMNSKYGNRLNGIKKYPITKKVKNSISEKLSSNEKVSNLKIESQGKILNIMFNVAEDVSIDDAKNIGNDSISEVPESIKGFYDIQVFITKKGEKGEEVDVTNSDGTTSKKSVKQFPIIGYKNTKQNNLVW